MNDRFGQWIRLLRLRADQLSVRHGFAGLNVLHITFRRNRKVLRNHSGIVRNVFAYRFRQRRVRIVRHAV